MKNTQKPGVSQLSIHRPDITSSVYKWFLLLHPKLVPFIRAPIPVFFNINSFQFLSSVLIFQGGETRRGEKEGTREEVEMLCSLAGKSRRLMGRCPVRADVRLALAELLESEFDTN
ncbi:uncharacterized [Tachysurus ichikawai]